MIISHFPFSSARLYLSMIDDEPILNGASFEWLAVQRKEYVPLILDGIE